MALSDTAIRSAKPRDKDYKLSDGKGLYLLVRTNGSKVWNQAYRFAGKQKKLTHGTYPELGLADAREKKDRSFANFGARQGPGNGKAPNQSRRFESGGKYFCGCIGSLADRGRSEGRQPSNYRQAPLVRSLGRAVQDRQPHLQVIDLDVRVPAEAAAAKAKLREIVPGYADLPRVASGSGRKSRPRPSNRSSETRP